MPSIQVALLNDNLENFISPGLQNLFKVLLFSLISFLDGINLSNTEQIFLANISSAGSLPQQAFTLGFIRWIDKNFCKSSFSAFIPFAFLIALLKTSINLSTNPFDFGWYDADFSWFIASILQTFSNFWRKLYGVVRNNCFRQPESCKQFV